MTQRYQRSRQKGATNNGVYVGRPSKWGNMYGVVGHKDGTWVVAHVKTCTPADPRTFQTKSEATAVAVALFRAEIEKSLKADINGSFRMTYLLPLIDQDVCCWCKPDEPCHGDVWLELAREELLPAGYFVKSTYGHEISVHESETFCEDCIQAVKNDVVANHPGLTGEDAKEDVFIVQTMDSDETPSSCDRCGCPIACSPIGIGDITTCGEWANAMWFIEGEQDQ